MQALVGRYDRAVFEPSHGRARVRLTVRGGGDWDAVLERGDARIAHAEGSADATLSADPRTWTAIADDVRSGMRAYLSGRLSTVQAGTGPPVVAIHGLGATKGSFLPTVDALADRFRVIAVDLPGFGDSDNESPVIENFYGG